MPVTGRVTKEERGLPYKPAVLCGNRHLSEWCLAQNACCGSVDFGLVLAKKFKCLVSINLSDVVRPLVDLVLRDKALARCSTIGHSELNPFEQRFGAVGDWVPCHVSFSFYPRRLGAVARAIDPTFDKLSRALRAN